MTSEIRPPIRTLTLGLPLATIAAGDLERSLTGLVTARRVFADAGYEVQTLRVASDAFWAGAAPLERAKTTRRVLDLDATVARHGGLLSLGPLLIEDRDDQDLASWGGELNAATTATHFSIRISNRDAVHGRAAVTAARVMQGIARSSDGGLGNFRFAAAAGVPAGTPFFPVAFHDGGPPRLSLGVQTAGVVKNALQGACLAEVTSRVRAALERALAPIARLGTRAADAGGWTFGGIDPSPAPLNDDSIGAAVEAVTGCPFGEASTLAACAAVTAAVRSLSIPACGYAGLMLPVLEDAVLARRAAEGRFGLQTLLLYSAVCGTGLDVVPLPGDTTVEALARVLTDVATLAARLGKPLAARLLLVPGASAGDPTHFDDPYLVNSRVLEVGG